MKANDYSGELPLDGNGEPALTAWVTGWKAVKVATGNAILRLEFLPVDGGPADRQAVQAGLTPEQMKALAAELLKAADEN